jgi:hypothetical protein
MDHIPMIGRVFSHSLQMRLNCGLAKVSDNPSRSRLCAYSSERICEYVGGMGCRFSCIDLMGTVEDWRLLRAKADALKQLTNAVPKSNIYQFSFQSCEQLSIILLRQQNVILDQFAFFFSLSGGVGNASN